jgi:hypothetical protein
MSVLAAQPARSGTLASATTLEWVLRVGACMCFVGHGAFGIITKQAWLPYFAVGGIGPATAYRLMPIVGAIDVVTGLLMLVRPRPALALWMVVWATWTALLRPVSGEPFWEALERAGNYGVPAAFAVLTLFPRSPGDFVRASRLRPLTPELLERVRSVLTAVVVLLLIGHGALGVLGKHGLVLNYASVVRPAVAAAITPWVGWLELALAALVAVWQDPALLAVVAGWKLATEALFVTAGAPVWEFVERGGSYAAPLALGLVAWMMDGHADE